jgi:tetratricopeptide (TPR) repeat protein
MILSFRRFCRFARLVLVLVVLSGAVSSRAADDVTARFEAANLLYEKGQFEPAAAAYEQMLADGVRSAGLLFNAGNAWFKSGQTGRAVAYWLQAEALDPRNDRIQINLRFAREAVTGGMVPVPLWPAQLKVLTLGEWAAIFLAAGWVFFGLLALGAWRPAWRGRIRVPAVISGLALAGTLTLLIITVRDRADSILAVVVVKEAVVRFGPLAESQSAFVARDGAEFRVTDRKDAWLKVEDALGREGWLPGNQVIQLRAGQVVSQPAAPGGGVPLPTAAQAAKR